jgi:hypothetical protein
VAVLAHPPLERPVEHRDLGPESLEHPRRQLRPLDDEPAERIEVGAAGGLDEPADARRRLQREHHALVAWEIRQQRPDDAGDLARDLGGRVVLVDESALLGHGEAGRELARDGLEREPAPSRVRSQ